MAADSAHEYNEFVKSNLRRNVATQLANGMFGQTGFRLIQAPTFVPSYLFALTGSDFLVGLARSLQAAGTVASPVIGASLIGHRSKILGATLTIGVLMRVNILGMAVAGFFLGADAFWPVLAMMVLLGFFSGMSQVAMNSLRAKVIPVNRRGVVSGARNFLAGISSAAASYVAGAYAIENEWLGHGYASVFLLAFTIGLIGLLGLAFTAEPRSIAVRDRSGIRSTLKDLRELLRADREFATFFVARALGFFGRMAMPFYILFAATRMEVSGATLGILTTVWMITSSVTNLFWGWVADRSGYKVTIVVTLLVWMLAHAQLLATETVTGMIAFFATMGMSSGGFAQSTQNMVLEFGKTEEIPLRLATSGTAVNLVNTIGPLMGGAIVIAASYETLFVTCIALQAVALGFILRVPDPRQSSA